MDWANAAKNLTLDELGTAVTHISLHSAYPGGAGSSEIAGGSPAYARKAVSWSAASAGAKGIAAALDFDVEGGDTVGWAGLWGASSAGTYYGSTPLGPTGTPVIGTALVSNVITAPDHAFTSGQSVFVNSTLGTFPAGLTDGQIAYVRDVSGLTFALAATAGGAAIDITSAGVVMVRRITVESFAGQGVYTITSLSLNVA